MRAENVNKLRETNVEYGILPIPKYDEAQEKYIADSWTGVMCVPISVSNPEMVGKTCEMLELIFDNVSYDVGRSFFGEWGTGCGHFLYTLSELVVTNDSSSFASWYAQWSTAAEAQIAAFNEEMKED